MPVIPRKEMPAYLTEDELGALNDRLFREYHRMTSKYGRVSAIISKDVLETVMDYTRFEEEDGDTWLYTQQFPQIRVARDNLYVVDDENCIKTLKLVYTVDPRERKYVNFTDDVFLENGNVMVITVGGKVKQIAKVTPVREFINERANLTMLIKE